VDPSYSALKWIGVDLSYSAFKWIGVDLSYSTFKWNANQDDCHLQAWHEYAIYAIEIYVGHQVIMHGMIARHAMPGCEAGADAVRVPPLVPPPSPEAGPLEAGPAAPADLQCTSGRVGVLAACFPITPVKFCIVRYV